MFLILTLTRTFLNAWYHASATYTHSESPVLYSVMHLYLARPTCTSESLTTLSLSL